jgi:hypothetical protein
VAERREITIMHARSIGVLAAYPNPPTEDLDALIAHMMSLKKK